MNLEENKKDLCGRVLNEKREDGNDVLILKAQINKLILKHPNFKYFIFLKKKIRRKSSEYYVVNDEIQS